MPAKGEEETFCKTRVEFSAAIRKRKMFNRNAKRFEEMILVASAVEALQTSLCEYTMKVSDTEIVQVREAQSLLELQKVELITLYEQQTRTRAELELLRTQNANRTAKKAGSDPATTESEQPAKCGNVFCGAKNCLSATPTPS